MTRAGRLPSADGGVRGVVAAGHPLSAEVGARALAEGGNATDAACAAAFAGAVAESPLTGPGAGGFMLVQPAGEAPTLLDFFVAVPGLGPAGRALDPGTLDAFTVPFGGAEQVFHIGPSSVAVPGMLAGLVEAHNRFGRLRLRDLVAPAVVAAREGVAISSAAAYLHEILRDMLTREPESADVYSPDGQFLAEGDVLVAPDLADTLEAVGERGNLCRPDGPVGRALLRLSDRGALVTETDLACYRVIEREPLQVDYRGFTLLTNPLPSLGGPLIGHALDAIAAGEPAASDAAHYRAAVRGAEAADAKRRDGGEPRRAPAGSTTHISVLDPEGGAVSLSSSNGSSSGVMAPGTGVLLNNMLGEQDLNPGGFGRGTPGERMPSMMAPTLLLRGGEPVAALGSAGSNRLRSAILQTVLGIVDAGLSPRAAVERPRVHLERLGHVLDVEAGVPEAALDPLVAEGYELRRWGERNLFFGGVGLAMHGPDGLDAAGDPRRGGAAFGVTRAGDVVRL